MCTDRYNMCKFCQADTFTNWRTEPKRCGGGGLTKCRPDFSSEIDLMLALSALQPNQCSCITRYLDLATCPCCLPSVPHYLWSTNTLRCQSLTLAILCALSTCTVPVTQLACPSHSILIVGWRRSQSIRKAVSALPALSSQ